MCMARHGKVDRAEESRAQYPIAERALDTGLVARGELGGKQTEQRNQSSFLDESLKSSNPVFSLICRKRKAKFPQMVMYHTTIWILETA